MHSTCCCSTSCMLWKEQPIHWKPGTPSLWLIGKPLCMMCCISDYSQIMSCRFDQFHSETKLTFFYIFHLQWSLAVSWFTFRSLAVSQIFFYCIKYCVLWGEADSAVRLRPSARTDFCPVIYTSEEHSRN